MDKVQKIREEVERIQLYTQSEVLKQVLDYIDKVQKEPKPKFNKGDKIQSVGKSTGHIYTFTIKGIQDDCYVLDDDKVLTFNMQDSWELVKEPVSDDLEEAADNALDKVWNTHEIINVRSCLEMFRYGAEWQKTKDMAVIKMIKELLEDFDKHCDEYHEAGFKHGQEALMKGAIDAKIGSFTNGTIYDADFNIDSNLKDNDKVKVIVIKED